MAMTDRVSRPDSVMPTFKPEPYRFHNARSPLCVRRSLFVFVCIVLNWSGDDGSCFKTLLPVMPTFLPELLTREVCLAVMISSLICDDPLFPLPLAWVSLTHFAACLPQSLDLTGSVPAADAHAVVDAVISGTNVSSVAA